MKKRKMILPMIAFALAFAGVFVSRQSQAAPISGIDYYYNSSWVCTVLPIGTCNNSPFGAICTFNPGTGYTEVYENKFSGQCDVVLRHSLNGGMLN